MNPSFFNFDLGDTVDMLRASVNHFATQEIAPYAAEIDQTNQFPSDLWPKTRRPWLTWNHG